MAAAESGGERRRATQAVRLPEGKRCRPAEPLHRALHPYPCSIKNDEAAKAGKLTFRGHAASHATGAPPLSPLAAVAAVAARRLPARCRFWLLTGAAVPLYRSLLQAPRSTVTSWTWSCMARSRRRTSSRCAVHAAPRMLCCVALCCAAGDVEEEDNKQASLGPAEQA